MKKITLILLLILTICFSYSYAKVDLSLQKEIEHSIKLGLRWLVTQQEEDGSWQHYPAITALSVMAILRSNPGISYEFPPVKKGLNFIFDCARLDGSIHLGELPNYNTSICLMALKEAKDPKNDELILKAEKYLLKFQLDEDEGYSPDSLCYGGVGYGGDERPDLSNLQWALEAMLEREVIPSDEINFQKKEIKNKKDKEVFLNRAIIFLQRCQNFKEYNPESYSGDDGGFMYEPGKSKLGGTTSYGSMTYAGLKSMIYAKLGKDDPRVKAAFDWINKHFVVESTPEMGNQGLFYYYQVMAKALNAYDCDYIVSDDGIKHNWRKELANQLMKIQNEQSWWQNENVRWCENNKLLVTAYSILSLEEIMRG